MTENRRNLFGAGVMAVLALGWVICSTPLYQGVRAAMKASVNYNSGIYAGVAQGYGGEVIALVTIDDNGISHVDLIGDNETPALGGVALKLLAPAFVEAGEARVDGISGSTITSNAAVLAVKNALDQASGSAELVDVDALMAKREEQADTGVDLNAVGEYLHDGGLRTGLATIHSMSKSKDAGEKDGVAQVESVVAAVVIDNDGRVVSCKLDMAQNVMNFTAQGNVIMKEEFRTKKELKDDYGMKKVSGIGKEWYQQAEAIEEFVVGKTAREIAGIPVNESGKTTDVDLVSGATVAIGSYQEAIVKAIQNAEEIGTREGDQLGLAVVTNMSKSKDASADADGQCQAYSVYMAVTIGPDGRITGSILDSSQGTVKFNAAGQITSDVNAGIKTKRELGDAYGMKGASGIGREWYQQADAFEEYIVGKTAEEVTGIVVNESGKPAEADLASSVTVAIGDFQAVVQKATADAE